MRPLLIAFTAVILGLVGCSAAPHPEAATTPLQTTVPLTGLENPFDLAVDAGGNVYVNDVHHFTNDEGKPDRSERVVVRAAGAGTQAVLPYRYASLLSDPDGAVWVVDGAADNVVKMPAGEHPQTLPKPDLGLRGQELAMDSAHNVYGVVGGGMAPGGGCCVPIHLVKATAHEVTELPFDGVNGLDGVAVDGSGAVYAGDRARHRVLKWTPGSATSVALPFNGLGDVADVAVDASGNTYVVDADAARVLTLAAGSDEPTVLPFDGLEHPIKVAVDGRNVYVLDSTTKTVLRLALPE